ncbi:Rid family detoxifying hydrolase [Ascidiimonas sp. W6]|uniref:RidA family protein n=1 Tax=Ascidiimonas meishanensis TaxID=3128903 RepID=UPI0030EDE1AA
MKLFGYILLMSFLFIPHKNYAQQNGAVFHSSHLKQKQNAPFSDAVEANGFLFLAGQIGFDYEQGAMINGGIKSETKQAIENIKGVLVHHGLSLRDVIKCTVILKNIEDFAAFNEVYVNYFPNKPARTTFAAAGLARESLIEIECIALKSKKSEN